MEIWFAWEGWIARFKEIWAKTYALQGNAFDKIFLVGKHGSKDMERLIGKNSKVKQGYQVQSKSF